MNLKLLVSLLLVALVVGCKPIGEVKTGALSQSSSSLNGSCLVAHGTATPDANGNCVTRSCESGFNLQQSGFCIANLCAPNETQPCHENNGTGSKQCNAQGSAWGLCGQFTSCNNGFNLQNGVCVSNSCTPNASQPCHSANGTGTQTCDSSGSAWGTCRQFTQCDPGFNLQNGSCVANLCVPNQTIPCSSGNGTGTQQCNSATVLVLFGEYVRSPPATPDSICKVAVASPISAHPMLNNPVNLDMVQERKTAMGAEVPGALAEV